ncbi:hypothetical protein HJC23_010016 [Cyclotella cryptica]|uniref:CDAN1-interacting nuclease 1 n=1 Tax=Cyclotella cryptica TaxID=29204 RepID=A0ABD3QB26_9STRA
MSTAETHTDPLWINWACEKVVPSQKCERKVMAALHRKGEWGRGRDLPTTRLNEIQNACDKNDMTLYQALSLRRTLLRSFKGGMKRVTHSDAMGGSRGQQAIASLFEEALVSFLSSCFEDQVNAKVFITEADLLAEIKKGSRPPGPTPDILFLRPVSNNGRLVKWIDAKMYYASASFANHKNIPNGKLKRIAERYSAFYGGEGAFVFGQGFCASLQDIVKSALLLDATPLDMTAVNDFQNSQLTMEQLLKI